MSKLHWTVWVDFFLSLVRTTKYRHYRPRFGARISKAERIGRGRRPPVARPQTLQDVEWLPTRRRYALPGDTEMGHHPDVKVFEIGKPFVMGGRVWICTDVGRRTICAVLRDELIESGDRCSPYSILERVIDAHDMDGCSPGDDAEIERDEPR